MSLLLREGNSFAVGLQRTVTIPASPRRLDFAYAALSFDFTTAHAIKDAFEVALLDAQGRPLVPVIAPGRDACFNVTEGLSPALAPGTTQTGSTVSVDIAPLAPGSTATFVLRLVNNDGDTNTSVRLACPNPNPIKFFVVDAATQRDYRYTATGGLVDSPLLASDNNNPRGVASSLAGDTQWVVDANSTVYVYNRDGSLRGSWQALAVESVPPTPQGIALDGTDLLIVAKTANTNYAAVWRFGGAASRLSGSATPTSFVRLPETVREALPAEAGTAGNDRLVPGDVVRMRFVGANPNPVMVGGDPLPRRVN
jgi:hypothetical protein